MKRVLTIQRVLTVGVLIYAALASCYTLKNYDLGWQLAAGRYVVETGQIPRHDVFSYTAAGKEWIYPAGGQVFFYLLYRLGGYGVLTMLGMAVCVCTVALLLFATGAGIRPDGQEPGPAGSGYLFPLLKLWLIALAIPLIAERTGVRAEMFTTLLFTAVLVIIWRLERGVDSPLYVLPVLFAIWANLHQGFMFGLAVLAVAVATGVVRHLAARSKPGPALRRLFLFSSLSAVAVLLNPWGWRLYTSLWRVRHDQAFQRGLISEASGVAWGWWRLKEVIRFDDPDAGFWLLLLAGLIGVFIALLRRQLLPALLMAGACWLSLQYARAQVFVVLAAVIFLPPLAAYEIPKSEARSRESPKNKARRRGPDERTTRILDLPGLARAVLRPGIARFTASAAAALLALMLVVRSADLASGRYYATHGDIATFGLGLSWYFPERALDFIERESLPGRVYHDYNLGGWVMWRSWPRYQVYIDGRAQPFSPNILLEQEALRAWAAGAPDWRNILDRWGINLILISLDRNGGYRESPAELCASPDFRLVYLDNVSGIWLRVRPENQGWLDRLGIGCPPPPPPITGSSRAERYNSLANAAQLYQSFGRYADALNACQQAGQIFSGDPDLRFGIAQALYGLGRLDEARQQYQDSLAIRDSAAAWEALGTAEARAGRHREAAEDFSRAAERSVLPQEDYRLLGEACLRLKEPERALEAFEKARATNRFKNESAWVSRQWLEVLEDGERRARAMLAGRQ